MTTNQEITTGYPIKQSIQSTVDRAQFLTIIHTMKPARAETRLRTRVANAYLVSDIHALLSRYFHNLSMWWILILSCKEWCGKMVISV